MTRMNNNNLIYYLIKYVLVVAIIVIGTHLYNETLSETLELEKGLQSCTNYVAGFFLEIDQLKEENKHLNEKLEKLYLTIISTTARRVTPYEYRVKVTMYHPVPSQTDDTPNITADGTVITISDASSYRYIAVSRDMLEVNGGDLNYGDYVVLYGTGKKDGLYQIRDTMAQRWTNRIDILESPSVVPYSFDEALLVKMDDTIFSY